LLLLSSFQDLEYLISKAVNTKNADYAVVTGVQIHNWASDLDDPRIPSMEFVAPARAYVVINGEKIDLDLQQVRLGLLAAAAAAGCCASKLACFSCSSWLLLLLKQLPCLYTHC
jgi:hypothetical protein